MALGVRNAGVSQRRPQLLLPSCQQHQCRLPLHRVRQAALSDASTTTSAVGPSSMPAAASGGPGPGQRQMYIQESLNFTGAELAARIPSMQAALRAQRAEAAAASGGAAAAQRLPASRPGSPAPSSSGYSYGYGGGPPPHTPPAPAPVPAARPFLTSPSSSRPSFVPGAAPVAVSERSAPTPDTQASTSSANAAAAAAAASNSSSSSVPSTSASSSGALPSAGNLAGLSASEKLQALQAVQAASRQVVGGSAAAAPSPYYVNAPKTIDIRMYDQLVAAHNKLSKRLGETNAHIDVLEEQINTCNTDLMAAFELFKQIAMEFGTTSRLAQSTAAAVQFGVDPQDAIDKIGKLQERLSTLEQAVLEQRKQFGLRVVRKVPVEWIGVASEVRVMGDFDGWTRGHELSAEDVTSDSVYARFEGTLLLRPGKYRVKFLVDNEWRLAADWPTEGEDNVLVVS